MKLTVCPVQVFMPMFVNSLSKLFSVHKASDKVNNRILVKQWLGQFQKDLTSFLHKTYPSSLLDNIRVIVIVWSLRGNIIRTALCWIVWHSVHSQQHTYMSSSYRSNRLGLSHWDPYSVCRNGCLQLYYCNMVEWFWLDSSLIFDDQLVSFSALTLLVWSSDL